MKLTLKMEALAELSRSVPHVEIDDIKPGDELSEMQAVVVLLARIEKRLERIEWDTTDIRTSC